MVLKHYQQTCRNWFRHVSQRVRIDRDEFEREFELLLYNCLLCYSTELRENSKFDHYFSVALKMKINDLIRQALAKKNQINRKAVPFSLKKHDIADDRPDHSLRLMEIIDSIVAHLDDPVDRKLIFLRLSGCGVEEAAEQSGIGRREYWSRMDRIKNKHRLVRELVAT